MAAPDKADWLPRERRLMRPAGYLALLGVVLFILSIVIQSSVKGSDLDTDVGLLTQYGEDGSTLIMGRLVYSLALLCFILPLYILFQAARYRAPDKVRGGLVAFCFIGPVLLAIQAPIFASGLKDAGEKYLEQAPGLEAQQPADAGDGAESGANAKAATKEGGAAAGTGQGEQAGWRRASGEVTTTPTEENATTSTESDSEDESDDEDTPEENLANDVIDDSGTVSFARALLLPALLGMVIAMVYIPLWSMRTGLLTRFMATFGMALGVSLILLPFAQLIIVLWFFAVGLVLLGRWPRGTPPAWAAGEAIPWDAPGSSPRTPTGPAGPWKAAGGEISDATPPDSGSASPPSGGTGDGQSGSDPPQKRKRRRVIGSRPAIHLTAWGPLQKGEDMPSSYKRARVGTLALGASWPSAASVAACSDDDSDDPASVSIEATGSQGRCHLPVPTRPTPAQPISTFTNNTRQEPTAS